MRGGGKWASGAGPRPSAQGEEFDLTHGPMPMLTVIVTHGTCPQRSSPACLSPPPLHRRPNSAALLLHIILLFPPCFKHPSPFPPPPSRTRPPSCGSTWCCCCTWDSLHNHTHHYISPLLPPAMHIQTRPPLCGSTWCCCCTCAACWWTRCRRARTSTTAASRCTSSRASTSWRPYAGCCWWPALASR